MPPPPYRRQREEPAEREPAPAADVPLYKQWWAWVIGGVCWLSFMGTLHEIFT